MDLPIYKAMLWKSTELCEKMIDSKSLEGKILANKD